MNTSTILPTLADRAMLVSLNIRQWAARKNDKAVTRKTIEMHGASQGAGTFHKALLAREALADLQTLSNEARQLWYSYSSPWLDDGQRIMTVAAYDIFTGKLRDIQSAWNKALDVFLLGYPRYIDEAKIILFRNGQMFNERDYPSTAAIGKKFSFEVRPMNVPDVDDFRANVSEDQAQIIKAQIEAAISATVTEAMQDVYKRIATVVGHMQGKLSDYAVTSEGKTTGIFRDTLVDNVKDLVERLPALNLTNDPKLNELYIKMKDRLCAYDAESLRLDGTLRKQVAHEAESILEQVSEFMA